MAGQSRRELSLFNANPIATVDYTTDIDFVGDGIRGHRLDVIAPKGAREGDPLPVYVYFHGGGWTSGDKSVLTKYCASQADAGMVVVNVNYRMATGFRMSHILDDADAALAWVRDNVAAHGGDPDRIVLGGDSAGGQITALYAAMLHSRELAQHYSIAPALDPASVIGLVQHCSVSDFSVMFDRSFILGLGFVRILLPHRGRGRSLRDAARYLSPIEWVGPGYPPVLVTTSERDYLYEANLNFADRLRTHGVDVESLIFDRSRRNTEHTWQQNARLPESQEVYARLQHFVARVASRAKVPALAV
ncbi:MAG: esterase [Microbacteriaceae bacterium]|nr:esterase [Microbacteriaceae bacterium]